MRRFDYLAALLALGFSTSGTAASFCVHTGAELTTALATAENNGQDDLIRMSVGSYFATGTVVGFSYASAEAFDLTVRGGYRNDGGGPCTNQEESSTGSRIDGQGMRPGLRVVANNGAVGLVTIERLTIRNGLRNGPGGGLELTTTVGGNLDLVVNRVVFDRNVAGSGGGMTASSPGLIRVSNSLFLGNECSGVGCAAQLASLFDNPATLRLTFASNTVVGNECLAGAVNCTVGGVRMGGTGRGRFHNNAFAFNDGIDLALAGGPATLVANNLLLLSGTPESNTFGQSVADPKFMFPLSDDYRLRYESPLRNAGQPLYFASLDLDGNARPHQLVIDIGAYENVDALLIDGFEDAP